MHMRCPDGIGRESWEWGGRMSKGWLVIALPPIEWGKKPSPRCGYVREETERPGNEIIGVEYYILSKDNYCWTAGFRQSRFCYYSQGKTTIVVHTLHFTSQKCAPAKWVFGCWGRFSQTLSYISTSATLKCCSVCTLSWAFAPADAPACIWGPMREIRHTLQHLAVFVSGLQTHFTVTSHTFAPRNLRSNDPLTLFAP